LTQECAGLWSRDRRMAARLGQRLQERRSLRLSFIVKAVPRRPKMQAVFSGVVISQPQRPPRRCACRLSPAPITNSSSATIFTLIRPRSRAPVDMLNRVGLAYDAFQFICRAAASHVFAFADVPGERSHSGSARSSSSRWSRRPCDPGQVDHDCPCRQSRRTQRRRPQRPLLEPGRTAVNGRSCACAAASAKALAAVLVQRDHPPSEEDWPAIRNTRPEGQSS